MKQEKRIRELVEESIYQSQQLSDRVQSEVDRAFGASTTLLNILLVVLTALPILVALGVWFLRPNVISQLLNEVKPQFYSDLENQKKILNQEIRELKCELLAQLSQLSKEIAEARQQRESFKKEIEILKNEFASDLSKIHIDAIQEKAKIVKKMGKLIPLSPEELVKPEKQQEIQVIKNQFEDLKSKNPALFSTAEEVMIQLICNLPKFKI